MKAKFHSRIFEMSSPNPRDRSRSPRFPSYPLNDAIRFADHIYEGIHRAPVDAETAFRLMGFKGRSGASATALGSVRQFGLIEGIGEKTRISELALRILQPESEAEKIGAIRFASEQPEVFRAVFDRFEGRLPSVDDPIKAFLIRELGFSKPGADLCTGSLRATYELVSAMVANQSEPSNVDDDRLQTVISAPIVEAKEPSFSSSSGMKSTSIGQPDFIIQLGGGRVAYIEIKGGEVDSRQLAKLERFLALQRELMEEDD